MSDNDKTIPLDELIPDAANARKHGERNRQAAKGSLERFGAARSIVIDGKGVVRAGNATLEAAKAAGITKARVVEADGSELVVVRRKDWSDTEATAYAIADNRIAEHAEWDEPVLLDQLRVLPEDLFAETGFTDAEFNEMFESMQVPSDADGKEYDESVAAEVEFLECPECGHKWPK